ncbi:hypothetical protein M0Q97_06560 [Candidatus Dojkabacteria bacterium]|jgi:hypothetical protein|nr:hypothetical protein [Candidatus Dojkabacteria bacterium]
MNNISYFFGSGSKSECQGSVIYAYGKGYTSIVELENDHKLIQENPIALLYVLKKNKKKV